MGYDYIRVTGGVKFTNNFIASEDTAGELSHKKRVWAGSSNGFIQNWRDFENYQWPQIKDEDLWMYEFVSDNLPDGMGIMACPESGFFEIPTEILIGYESMAMMSIDHLDLLAAIFARVRDILCKIYEKVVDIDKVVGFFQGDDMGYKTGLLMSPDFFKEYSLPGHKRAAEIAHSRNKIYMLHSCGQLETVMDYLIDEIKIDAKQSYEDVICPVGDFYKKYSSRIGVVGGLDVNLLASADEKEVRKRIRHILGNCHNSGRYALGSGNTIANYCKKENVLSMFDEAFLWI
jgi:uroporphyrinogen decarboxylase